LPDILGPYACFHGGVAVVCVAWAIVRLRTAALEDTAAVETTRGRQRYQPQRAWVPRWCLDVWPLLWKELIIDSGPRRGLVARLGIGVLIAAVFFPPVRLVEWFGGLSHEGLKQP